jgi:acyl-CoA thioester hydrolase
MTVDIPETGQSRTVGVILSDLDALGMVHHLRYPLLFERAFTEYWAERGYTWNSPDAFQVTKTITLTYYAPIREVAPVAVTMWVNHVGRTSVDYGFAVRSEDLAVLHATGSRVTVHLDPATGTPAPWTDQGRADMTALARPVLA